MEANFSNKLKEAIGLAREAAVRMKSAEIKPEHLFFGAVSVNDKILMNALKTVQLDANEVLKAIQNGAVFPLMKSTEIKLSTESKIMKISYLEAKVLKCDTIEPRHLVLSILRNQDNVITNELLLRGITREMLKSEIELLE